MIKEGDTIVLTKKRAPRVSEDLSISLANVGYRGVVIKIFETQYLGNSIYAEIGGDLYSISDSEPILCRNVLTEKALRWFSITKKW